MPRKGRVNRTMLQKLHAVTRAKERYDLDLTHRSLMALSKRVRAEGRKLADGVRGREVWELDHHGQRVVVAFDPERGHIVSFLPFNWGTKPEACASC